MEPMATGPVGTLMPCVLEVTLFLATVGGSLLCLCVSAPAGIHRSQNVHGVGTSECSRAFASCRMVGHRR